MATIDLLIATAEFIQIGVGVLLQHVEGSDVVLPAVVVVIAEHAHAEVCVVENEAAEIAYKWLNADARGNEIVIARQIAQMNFTEGLLQCEELLFASGPVLRIWIHDVSFFHVDVVVIVNTEDAERPIDWLECGFAFEKIDADGKIVCVKELVAAAKKFRAVRALCAHTARRR